MSRTAARRAGGGRELDDEPTARHELVAEAAALTGLAVRAGVPAAWGFSNRTDILTLDGGRRVVLQRYRQPVVARQRLRLAHELAPRLRAAGIPTPRLLRAEPDVKPPWALFAFVRGEPGPSLPVSRFIDLADAMGRLLPTLAAISTAGLRLPDLWADPRRLASRARVWLGTVDSALPAAASGRMAKLIATLPAELAGRSAVLAHGDFAPANVLVRDGSITALVDYEFARRADPLFDAAWWGWMVRYHHEERWLPAWRRFLAVAGIEATPAQERRIGLLQVVRCLELAGGAGNERLRRTWTTRLETTLGWTA